MVAVSLVSQMRLYKSVSPVIKRKYTPVEAKDNANDEHEMKNFQTSARISCFSIFQLVVYTSHFLDFSYLLFALAAPTSRVPEMNLPSGQRRNSFRSIIPFHQVQELRKTSVDNSFFCAHYANLHSLFPAFNFRQIFAVSRKDQGTTGMFNRTRILSTFRYISSPFFFYTLAERKNFTRILEVRRDK